VVGDSLTSKSKEIPIHKRLPATVTSTYVPGRNIIFLSYELSCAQSVNAQSIFIGVNSVNFSNYPDCTPEFVEAYNNVLKALKIKNNRSIAAFKFKKSADNKTGYKIKCSL
jgi:7-cyano-7-deazaguanine synthase